MFPSELTKPSSRHINYASGDATIQRHSRRKVEQPTSKCNNNTLCRINFVLENIIISRYLFTILRECLYTVAPPGVYFLCSILDAVLLLVLRLLVPQNTFKTKRKRIFLHLSNSRSPFLPYSKLCHKLNVIYVLYYIKNMKNFNQAVRMFVDAVYCN